MSDLGAWNALYDAVVKGDAEEVEGLIAEMDIKGISKDEIRNIINREVSVYDLTDDIENIDKRVTLYDLTDNISIKNLLLDAGAPNVQGAGLKKRAKKRGGRTTKRRAKRRGTKRRGTKRRGTKRRFT